MLWGSKCCFISSQQNTKRISKEESKNLVETRIGWNNHLTVLWPTSTTSDSKKKRGLYTLSTLLVIFNQNFIICSSSDMLNSLCWHLQGRIAVQPIAFRSAFNSVCNARFSQFKQQPVDKIKSLSTPFLPKLFANTSQYGSKVSHDFCFMPTIRNRDNTRRWKAEFQNKNTWIFQGCTNLTSGSRTVVWYRCYLAMWMWPHNAPRMTDLWCDVIIICVASRRACLYDF